MGRRRLQGPHRPVRPVQGLRMALCKGGGFRGCLCRSQSALVWDCTQTYASRPQQQHRAPSCLGMCRVLSLDPIEGCRPPLLAGLRDALVSVC